MEWSVGQDKIRYTVDLVDSDGIISLTSLKIEDEEIPISDISVTRDSNSNRLLLKTGEKSKLVHIVKIKDSFWIHLDGRVHIVNVHEVGHSSQKQNEGGLVAPMPGTIIQIFVKEGQRVRKGQNIMVIEAMKMEHKIQSPRDGEVTSLFHEVGQRVDMDALLVEIND